MGKNSTICISGCLIQTMYSKPVKDSGPLLLQLYDARHMSRIQNDGSDSLIGWFGQ
jgi:hypothetical protein